MVDLRRCRSGEREDDPTEGEGYDPGRENKREAEPDETNITRVSATRRTRTRCAETEPSAHLRSPWAMRPRIGLAPCHLLRLPGEVGGGVG
jgi:hypothetical protein